jgi:hypothetical protein
MTSRKFTSCACKFVFACGILFPGFSQLAVLPVFAQLTWEATQVDQTLTLGQENAEAVFRFQNNGTYPVTIRSTSASCGCTTAELGQKVYRPGEQGQIKTRFDVGGRTGQRRNTVQVQTDDPAHSTVTLTFAVDIPTFVTITPRILQWRVGGGVNTQSVLVDLNPDSDVAITGVKVDDDNFEAVVIQGDAPHQYRLQLTPRHTNSPVRTVFALQTEPKVKNEASLSFYAFVR